MTMNQIILKEKQGKNLVMVRLLKSVIIVLYDAMKQCSKFICNLKTERAFKKEKE